MNIKDIQYVILMVGFFTEQASPFVWFISYTNKIYMCFRAEFSYSLLFALIYISYNWAVSELDSFVARGKSWC